MVLIGALAGVLLSKACDLVWPNSPVLVKELTDTVTIVHTVTPLPAETDSLLTIQLKQQLLNIELLDRYDSYLSHKKDVCSLTPCRIITGFPFPRGRGYEVKELSSMCTISLVQNDGYMDITYSFFREDYRDIIYALEIIIYKKGETGKTGSTIVFSQYYEPNKTKQESLVRIAGVFNSDDYVLDAGFYLVEDKEKEYPTYYRKQIDL